MTPRNTQRSPRYDALIRPRNVHAQHRRGTHHRRMYQGSFIGPQYRSCRCRRVWDMVKKGGESVECTAAGDCVKCAWGLIYSSCFSFSWRGRRRKPLLYGHRTQCDPSPTSIRPRRPICAQRLSRRRARQTAAPVCCTTGSTQRCGAWNESAICRPTPQSTWTATLRREKCTRLSCSTKGPGGRCIRS